MNSITDPSLLADPALVDPHYALDDNLTRPAGRVFLTGTQALVRLLCMQKKVDEAQGIATAGFVSGYRGSPLGAVDQELWRARHLLQQHQVEFLPAINEELGATAVMGSQQVEADPTRKVDGVFAMWYGKGPGVDRAGDALKHGHVYGSSPRGGVLDSRRRSRLRIVLHAAPERAGVNCLEHARHQSRQHPGIPGIRPVRLGHVALHGRLVRL